jgi:predicted RecA/RadA family phage recombinase
MATNYDSPGEVVELTAPVGGVVANSVYLIGRLVVVATVTAAAGAKFSGAVTGVWRITKVSAEPWTEGMAIYLNTGTGSATSISTGGNILIGATIAAAANPTTTARVRLNGVSV